MQWVFVCWMLLSNRRSRCRWAHHGCWSRSSIYDLWDCGDGWILLIFVFWIIWQHCASPWWWDRGIMLSRTSHAHSCWSSNGTCLWSTTLLPLAIGRRRSSSWAIDVWWRSSLGCSRLDVMQIIAYLAITIRRWLMNLFMFRLKVVEYWRAGWSRMILRNWVILVRIDCWHC